MQQPAQSQPADEQAPDAPALGEGERPDSGNHQDSNDTAQKPAISQSDFAAQVVVLVNAERAKAGLNPLSTDSAVQRAAQVRAGEIGSVFSHTRPNGSSAFTALAEQGASYRGAGENIAYGQQSPEAVMQAWMNSQGHRANILNPNFTTIGVGYTVISGTPCWTQFFTY